MRMNRRTFIGSILALGAAPAIVRASSLMPVTDLSRRWTYSSLWLPVVYAEDLTVDVTTLCDTEQTYSYSASFDVAVPHELMSEQQIIRVWANGEEVRSFSLNDRVISFKDLNLAPYGSQIPEITAQFRH